MTAQHAFHNWLVYLGVIAGIVVMLAACTAVCVVALASRRREE